MKAKIPRTDAELFIIEQHLDELAAVADVVTTQSTDEDALALEATDAEIILTCYTTITEKVIEAAKNLKGIVKYGVGTDAIDIEAATQRGVMVINCPDYGSDTVADHAFALLIALARRIPVLDRVMQENAWAWPAASSPSSPSAEGSSPAVSTSRNRRPSNSISSAIRSRVIPGRSSTKARLWPA